MTKAELQNKSLSDLHTLASEAGVEKFRMLSKGELVERLADGDGGSGDGGSGSGGSGSGSRSRSGSGSGSGARRERGEDGESGERPRRRRRRSRAEGGADEDHSEREAEGEAPASAKDEVAKGAPKRESGRSAERDSGRSAERESAAPAGDREPDTSETSRPRRRRRRRFGRRGKGEVTLQGLLLPPEPGRQAILAAESREACTALLRSIAADIAADSKGPDPVALLIDPSPEELADWRREAPQAEIVAAGQPHHAADALAQAARRAGEGEDVFLLVDSLSRLAEATGEAEAAKEFFDAGREQGGKGGGSLTVVAALERPS